MISSGMKRGLAATAVSAMAVTGLPFLASTASATPLATTIGANAVEFYSQQVAAVSTKNDGTNTTVSLAAGGGANVTSVLFQYSTDGGTTYTDVPGGIVARNADGVFAVDWANPPATLTNVRAVPDTGEANADVQPATVANDPVVAPAKTVELGSEGALGVFQSPYTDADGADNTAGNADDEPLGDYLGVRGTTSGATTGVTVSNVSHEAQTTTDTATATSTDADGTGSGTTGAFGAILDIDGYNYSAGSEANQIALNATTTGAIGANTDDAEASTLYIQQIASITANPTSVQLQGSTDTAPVTLTVVDQNGKPVANAQVAVGADTDTDTTGPDTDTDGVERILGYTDAKGQYTTTAAQEIDGPGDWKFYVNTNDNNAFESGTDKSVTVTATEYTPALATVDIKNERNRSALDLDEMMDSDDFTIETRDQNGNLIDENLTGADVQYRWVVDPAATGVATQTSDWVDAETTGGKFAVPGLLDADWQRTSSVPTTDVQFPNQVASPGDLPAGSYTIEARRPNVGGSGLTNATPETFTGSESEITWDEGADANAPVEGDITLNGKLALIDGGAGLAGRLVTITFGAGREDARFVDTAGADADATGTTATAVTDANGNFSVKVDDQAGPSNVPDNPEDATVDAIASESATDGTSLQNTNGADDSTTPNDPANAQQDVVVHFQAAPTVGRIDVQANTLDPRNPTQTNSNTTSGPGVPVDLDITVYGKDNDTNPANDLVLKDQAISVSVDRGFLSPNAEAANDLKLAAGHTAAGSLWGFFQNDGLSKSITTGDSGTNGVVAAIEKDTDFDDNGLTDLTVTVKSGDVTKTMTVAMNAGVLLNQTDSMLKRTADSPQGNAVVGQDVFFNLYVHDQFGNLVGDEFARVSDDSTVADFQTDEDFDQTLSDFTTSGPGIRAFSDAPAVQTLTAAMTPNEVVVDATGKPDSNSKSETVKSAPIKWAAAPVVPVAIRAILTGSNNGARADRLTVDAPSKAHGAVVRLYKVVNGVRRLVGKSTLNLSGNRTFRVADRNGRAYTKYVAVVSKTARTKADTTNTKRVR